jgi:hypothetical protein
MARWGVLVVEAEREDIARTFACPVCGVGAGRWCRSDKDSRRVVPFSHTARYNLAAAAGLVPALPRDPTKGGAA